MAPIMQRKNETYPQNRDEKILSIHILYLMDSA